MENNLTYNNGEIELKVSVDDKTVWLNKNEIAQIFKIDRSVVSRHIKNIFKDKELDKSVVCAFFAHTTQHGAIKGKTQIKKLEYYNLDVIISVGYRVKSKQGTQFRIWANNILKDYLLKGYALNNRMNRIEDNMYSLMKKVDEIDLQVNTNLPSNQAIFYDGQFYDAYVFIADLIRTAEKEIILIDNYIDDTILTLFTKRNKNVKLTIYTQKISQQLKLDIEKHNKQYPTIEVKKLKKSHDRFLIIDKKYLYHIGASLKDLGNKWFAVSKFEFGVDDLLNRL